MWAPLYHWYHYCTGFVALRATSAVECFLIEWENMLQQPSLNQYVLNTHIKRSKFNHICLLEQKFHLVKCILIDIKLFVSLLYIIIVLLVSTKKRKDLSEMDCGGKTSIRYFYELSVVYVIYSNGIIIKYRKLHNRYPSLYEV